ncbi:MAG: hypothetical protein AB8G22_04940 [Saprospiraceae bacterium]
MKTPFIFLLLLISQISFSQGKFKTGYYISNTGDRVEGYIKKGNEFVHCQGFEFKSSSVATAKVFDAESAQGYGLADGRYFAALDIPIDSTRTQAFFLEQAVAGILDLFKLSLVNLPPRLFVKNQAGELEELIKTEDLIKVPTNGNILATYRLTDRKYVITLQNLMLDCMEVHGKVKYTEYDYVKLSDLIFAYNNCIDSASAVRFPIFDDLRDENFGVYTGLAMQAFRILPSNSTASATTNTVSPVFLGLFYEFNRPTISERLFVRFDFSLEKNKSSAAFRQANSSTDPQNFIDYFIDLELTNLQIRPSFVYNFKAKRWQPYAQLGLKASTTFFKNNSLIIQRHPSEMTGFISPVSTFAVPESPFSLSGFAGVGLQYIMDNNKKIFADLRYHRRRFEGIKDSILAFDISQHVLVFTTGINL